MPCYDKKLEASRLDFYNEAYATRDVDCVLTTGELQLMMREKGFDLTTPVPGEEVSSPPSLSPVSFHLPELVRHPGSSSGSYLQHIIDTLSTRIPNPVLVVKQIRSADYEEIILSDSDTGEIVFKGAKCYGFRNLQNVVRKVGKEHGLQVGKGAAASGKMPRGTNGVSLRTVARRRAGAAQVDPVHDRGYDYVEVMACPGGCINGGGQIKSPQRALPSLSSVAVDDEGFRRDWETDGVHLPAVDPRPIEKWGDKEWTRRVEAVYWDGLPSSPAPPNKTSPVAASDIDAFAVEVLAELCQPTSRPGTWADRMDDEAEARRQSFFRTEYRAVESEVIGLAVKW